MKTVLVKYKEYSESAHPLLDGGYIKKSKIVKVADLFELNELFSHAVMTKVKILETESNDQ